jgi:hypothetical protein
MIYVGLCNECGRRTPEVAEKGHYPNCIFYKAPKVHLTKEREEIIRHAASKLNSIIEKVCNKEE